MKAKWKTRSLNRFAGSTIAICPTLISSLLTATSYASSRKANCCANNRKTTQKPAQTAPIWVLRVICFASVLLFSALCRAQTTMPEDSKTAGNPAEVTTPEPQQAVFPHSATWPFYVGGQLNMIFQVHPPF